MVEVGCADMTLLAKASTEDHAGFSSDMQMLMMPMSLIRWVTRYFLQDILA
jgi:hypothetical protein